MTETIDEPIFTYEIVLLYSGNFTVRFAVSQEQFKDVQSKYRTWEANPSSVCVVYDTTHPDILSAYRLDMAIKVDFHITRIGHNLN